MSTAQEQANIQRAEAKNLMLKHFGIRKDESNGEIERIVDCIISAALLEMVVTQEDTVKNAELYWEEYARLQVEKGID